MSVIDVVAAPKVHHKHPGNHELGNSSPDERPLVEKSRAPVFIEVSVFKHGGVSVEVHDSSCMPHDCILVNVGSPSESPS